MLYQTIIASPDDAPFVGEVREAMPFIADTTAMGMAAELVSYTERTGLSEMFEGFQLPHPTVWLEHRTDNAFLKISDQLTGGRSADINDRFKVIGYLFKTLSDDSVEVSPFTVDQDGEVAEPFAGIRLFAQTGKTQAFIDSGIYNQKIAQLAGHGVPLEQARGFFDSHIAYLLDTAIAGAVIGSRLFTLMSAKDSPLDRVETEPMSRQLRRQFERRGVRLDDVSRKVTRIVLNEEGRNHMLAVSDNAGGEARRKAHWVRGHLMRTETKGYVWRKSHVRGIGDPVMRPRAVSAILAEEPDESLSL